MGGSASSAAELSDRGRRGAKKRRQHPSMSSFQGSFLLDNAFSQAPRHTLIKHGINVRTGTDSRNPSENGKPAESEQAGEIEPSDMILVSAGVKPAGALAEKAGLALG